MVVTKIAPAARIGRCKQSWHTQRVTTTLNVTLLKEDEKQTKCIPSRKDYHLHTPPKKKKKNVCTQTERHYEHFSKTTSLNVFRVTKDKHSLGFSKNLRHASCKSQMHLSLPLRQNRASVNNKGHWLPTQEIALAWRNCCRTNLLFYLPGTVVAFLTIMPWPRMWAAAQRGRKRRSNQRNFLDKQEQGQ